MPVHNEESVIRQVVEALDSEILSRITLAELVVVDDASTDGSPRILDELASTRPRIRVVHAEVNRGHGPSLRRAIVEARGDWVFHVDSDGQFVVKDFWRLWDARAEADLVLGFRRQRHDPVHRLVLARMVRLAVFSLAGRRVMDANVPFRIFRRELWQTLAPAIGEGARIPSIMISLGAAVRGARIVEVPVTHLARPYGPSSLRHFKLVSFSLVALRQLLAFRYRVSRLR
ncbi:MAG: glycosyltransferase family 2 protein [Acidimicrobiales bacterium]